jgi:hypothetical protein
MTVPLSALVSTAKTTDVAGDVIGDLAPTVIPVTEPLARAVETLSEQLGVANRRINELQTALTAERDRAERSVEELLTHLTDARTAAMITGCEAEALRTQLELLTERRPWWRRWFRRAGHREWGGNHAD